MKNLFMAHVGRNPTMQDLGYLCIQKRKTQKNRNSSILTTRLPITPTRLPITSTRTRIRLRVRLRLFISRSTLEELVRENKLGK